MDHWELEIFRWVHVDLVIDRENTWCQLSRLIEGATYRRKVSTSRDCCSWDCHSRMRRTIGESGNWQNRLRTCWSDRRWTKDPLEEKGTVIIPVKEQEHSLSTDWFRVMCSRDCSSWFGQLALLLDSSDSRRMMDMMRWSLVEWLSCRHLHHLLNCWWSWTSSPWRSYDSRDNPLVGIDEKVKTETLTV